MKRLCLFLFTLATLAFFPCCSGPDTPQEIDLNQLNDLPVISIETKSNDKKVMDFVTKPVSEQLPADLYDMLTDRFCYAEPVDEQGNPGKSQPYGIYISDLVDKSPYCKEPIALAICGNTKREKNAEEFVRYLLEQAEGMQGIAAE